MTAQMDTSTVNRDERAAMALYDRDPWIAFDLETTGLRPAKGHVAVIAIGAPNKPPSVLHYPRGVETRSAIIKWLQQRILVGHNITSFDIPFLMQHGYDPFVADGWRDTMTLEQLIRPNDRRSVSASLAATIKRHLGKEIDKSIDHSGWVNPELRDEQVLYAASDVGYLLPAHEKQIAEMHRYDLDAAYAIECKMAPVVSNMIAVGMPINEKYRRRMIAVAKREAFERSAELAQLLGKKINPRSAKQVREAFHETLGVELHATDADTLADYAHEPGAVGRAAELIIEIRKQLKTGMYGDDWDAEYVVNGRVNASYRTMNTETARFSSSNPNIQQIPKAHRGMFAAPSGSVLVSVDYSAIEVLVAGVLMKEHRIINAYTSGRDLHSYVASLLYRKSEDSITREERTIAKAASFTLLFAGGVPGMQTAARAGGVELSRADALQAISAFFAAFPRASKYISTMRSTVTTKKSVTLRIPSGPRRVLTKYHADPRFNVTPSRVINTLVQGTAASGLKRALSILRDQREGKYIRAVVHDEIVAECPEREAREVEEAIKFAMIHGMEEIIGVQPKVESSVSQEWK